METSLVEYIDLLYEKLGKLAFEEIQYSDYDQMTDWLGEISKQVKRLEKKQEPMNTILSHGECGCPRCEVTILEGDEYCWHCGQKLDWGGGV